MRKTDKDVISFNVIMACVLKKLREEKDLHGIDFAERSGIPRSVYTKYASGAYPIHVGDLNKVAEFMDLSMVDILECAEEYSCDLRRHGVRIIHGKLDAKTRDSIEIGSRMYDIDEVYEDFGKFYKFELKR